MKQQYIRITNAFSMSLKLLSIHLVFLLFFFKSDNFSVRLPIIGQSYNGLTVTLLENKCSKIYKRRSGINKSVATCLLIYSILLFNLSFKAPRFELLFVVSYLWNWTPSIISWYLVWRFCRTNIQMTMSKWLIQTKLLYYYIIIIMIISLLNQF